MTTDLACAATRCACCRSARTSCKWLLSDYVRSGQACGPTAFALLNQPRAPLIHNVPHQDTEESEADAPDEALQPTTDSSRRSIDDHRTLYVGQPEDVGSMRKRRRPARCRPRRRKTIPVAAPQESQGAAEQSLPDIIITSTPEGLLIASEDVEALDVLEDLLSTVATSANNPRYSLFYLQHLEAEEAKTLLSTLFSGGTAASDAGGDDSRSGALGFARGEWFDAGHRYAPR